MKKYSLIAFLYLFLIFNANSQEIKEFFIPNSTSNKATFYTPNKAGARTEMTRTIYYINKGSTYELIDAQMFGTSPSSILRKRVEFADNEVKMTSSVSTTLTETKKERIHNPASILLKIPSKGQKVAWSFKDISGDLTKCVSFWDIEKIDGKDVEVIKVEQKVEGLESVSKIETYVRGIGLWRTELKGSDGKIQLFDKFDKLGFDSNAK